MKSRRLTTKSTHPIEPFWGHPELGSRLRQALASQALPPVIIFSGPKGVGKSAAASWLVQADRCTATQRPCGRCPECRHALDGKHPDAQVIEGRAESPIPIETVRQALRTYQHRPTVLDRSRWLIIRNAEWLSPPAVSALLKFLEEPPPRTQIILTTAHTDLLPQTIRSRASDYRWHLVPGKIWDASGASRPALARAAGRPAWLQVDADEERVWLDEILLVLAGQPLPAAWLKLEPEYSRRLLDTLELVLRDLVLTQTKSSGRLLWPDQHQQYQTIMAQSHRGWLECLERLSHRARQLRHHVAPRLILQDALAYA